MDEHKTKDLEQLALALKALAASVEKMLMIGEFAGLGDVVAKKYQVLHRHAAGLLPDDFFVREVLALELTEGADDRAKLAQVSLMVSQLRDYVEGLLKVERRATFTAEIDDLKGLGREIQDQILSITRQSLRRAIRSIDVNVEIPEPKIPKPPRPPEPPHPPKSKRHDRRHEDDDDLI